MKRISFLTYRLIILTKNCWCSMPVVGSITRISKKPCPDWLKKSNIFPHWKTWLCIRKGIGWSGTAINRECPGNIPLSGKQGKRLPVWAVLPILWNMISDMKSIRYGKPEIRISRESISNLKNPGWIPKDSNRSCMMYWPIRRIWILSKNRNPRTRLFISTTGRLM